MAKETVHDLIVRLSAEDAKFREPVRRSKRDIDELDEGAKKAGRGIAIAIGSVAVNALRGFTGWLARGVAGLGDLTARGVLVAAQGIDQMAESTRDANGELTAMGKAGKVAAGGLEAAAKAVMVVSNLFLGMKLAAAAAIAATAVASARAAAEIGPAWNRVRTILGDTNNEFKPLRNEVSRLAADMGVKGVDAINTFYEVLGAMPDLIKEPARALEVLRVALEASIADPNTDPATAARAITGILNAYSMEAERAREVSDALFAAQDAGVTTFGEIADSFGSVGSLAASMGVDFKELLGILAAVSATGVSTSESFTQMRAILTGLQKPTADAIAAAREHGIVFTEQAMRTKGLVPFLEEIIQKTEGKEGELARFFGSVEANSLLAFIAQNGGDVTGGIESVGEAAGRTARNVDIMNQSSERSKQLAEEARQGALREVGPVFDGLGSAWNKLGQVIANSASKSIEWIKALQETAQEWYDSDAGRQAMEARYGVRPGDPITRETWAGRRGTPSAPAPLYTLPAVRAQAPTSTPEQATIEYATQKVKDYAAAQEAAAVAEYQRTQDYDAYERATREAANGVRNLALAEAARLRAAGTQSVEINKFIAEVTPSPTAPERTNERDAREARRYLDISEDARREAELLARVWTGDLANAPAGVASQVGALLRVERELRDTERERAEAAKRNYDTSGLDARIRGLQAERAEGERVLAILGPLQVAYDEEMRRIGTAEGLGEMSSRAAEEAARVAGVRFNAGLAAALRSAAAAGTLSPAMQRLFNDAMLSVRLDPTDLISKIKQGFAEADTTGWLNPDQGRQRVFRAPTEVTSSMQDVRRAVLAVANAEREVTLAQNDPARKRAAELALAAAREQLKEVARVAIAAAEAAGLTEKQMGQFLAGLSQGLEAAGIKLDDLGARIETFAEKADAVAHLADAVARVAEALGDGGTAAADFLRGIGNAAAAFAELKRAKERYDKSAARAEAIPLADIAGLLSGYAGAVAGVFGIAQSLIGGGDSERDRILEQNNEELRRVALELRGFRVSADVAGQAREAVGSLQAREGAILQLGHPGRGARGVRDQNRMIEQILAGSGLSLDELLAVAEDQNIELFDDKGRLVAGALDDLAERLGYTAEALTRWGKGLDAQRSRAELRADVRDEEDSPLAQLKREMQLVEQFAPDIAERYGLGSNATTAEIEAGIRALLDDIDAERLTLEDVGGFSSFEELISVITNTENALDGMSDAVKSATDAMVNIPRAWNAALYIATYGLRPDAPATAPQPDPQNPAPGGPGSGTTGQAGAGGGVKPGGEAVTVASQDTYNVSITGTNSMTPREMFDAVEREGLRRKRAGAPTRIVIQ